LVNFSPVHIYIYQAGHIFFWAGPRQAQTGVRLGITDTLLVSPITINSLAGILSIFLFILGEIRRLIIT